MHKTSFTVILTTYNSGGDVLKTINSIRDQKGKGEAFDLELIVVDDCSTDGTRDLLALHNVSFESTLANSGGANKGRNIALDLATKEWIIIADHDDIWFPDRLLTLSELRTDSAIISSSYEINDTIRNTRHSLSQKEAPRIIAYSKNETFLCLISKSKINKQISYLGALCFKNKPDIPRFEEEVGKVDFDWICKLFHLESSVHVNKDLYIRVQDGNNLSRNEDYRLADFKLSTNYLNSISEDYPSETEAGRKGLLGTMARYYYAEERMKKAREYFLKAGFSGKNILYFITSFVGYKLINKKVRVFD